VKSHYGVGKRRESDWNSFSLHSFPLNSFGWDKVNITCIENLVTFFFLFKVVAITYFEPKAYVDHSFLFHSEMCVRPFSLLFLLELLD